MVNSRSCSNTQQYVVVVALICALIGQLRLAESMVVPDAAPSKTTIDTRRIFLKTTFASVTATAMAPSAARSLDMDAFATQQLQSSSSASSSTAALSEDQALCKFGQPSPQRGEACLRAGMSTKPTKKGGVDAFGQVERYVYLLFVEKRNERAQSLQQNDRNPTNALD